MTDKSITVEGLLEEIDIKDRIIKSVNNEVARLEAEKEETFSLFLKERITCVEMKEELEEARRQLKMMDARINNVQRKLKVEFETREQDIIAEMTRKFEEQGRIRLEEQQAENETREEKLMAIIENQNALMAAMEEVYPKSKGEKFLGWISGCFK